MGSVTAGLQWPTHRAADLFPLLDDIELAALAADIAERGLLQPVWLYDDPDVGVVLLDGRNRARACEIANVRVETRHYRGTDPDGFAVALNLKRRHLTPGQLAFITLELEKLYAVDAKEAQVEAGRNYGANHAKEVVADLPQPSKRDRKSREKAAKVTGSSGRAVGQAKRIQENAPDLEQKVKAGELALDRADRIIRDREAEQRKIDQARAEAARVPEPLTVDVRHGDFREVLSDLTEVDAIITDPPYPAEYLPLLGDLACWADKVLAEDGVLAVLIGQTHLPEVFALLNGHRPYRWTACYMTSGPGYVSHPRRVQSNWKPLLVYGGGARFGDVFRSEGTDADAKDHHKWGQDYSAFHSIIERLTKRGDTVVDPFAGGGTTLLAAHALGRHVIGCDVDAEAVETSRNRFR